MAGRLVLFIKIPAVYSAKAFTTQVESRRTSKVQYNILVFLKQHKKYKPYITCYLFLSSEYSYPLILKLFLRIQTQTGTCQAVRNTEIHRFLLCSRVYIVLALLRCSFQYKVQHIYIYIL